MGVGLVFIKRGSGCRVEFCWEFDFDLSKMCLDIDWGSGLIFESGCGCVFFYFLIAILIFWKFSQKKLSEEIWKARKNKKVKSLIVKRINRKIKKSSSKAKSWFLVKARGWLIKSVRESKNHLHLDKPHQDQKVDRSLQTYLQK